MGAFGATIRTLFLFLFMFGLFALIGYVLGYIFGANWVATMVAFILLAAAINVITYFFSAKIVLFTYKAKMVSESEAPRLYRIVSQVAQKANLPMPKVAIIPTQTPNAFATGRNPRNAVVAATEGILQLLDDNELEGVLSHEMAHVRNRDILVMTIAATLAGAISIAARWALIGGMFGGNRNQNGWLLLVVAITAPIAALMIQLAVSRSREYGADRGGAEICGRPLYLARALEKLEEGNRRRPLNYGSPASSSMFIVNPFNGGGFVSLFSTHPPVKERVRRLQKMADDMGQY